MKKSAVLTMMLCILSAGLVFGMGTNVAGQEQELLKPGINKITKNQKQYIVWADDKGEAIKEIQLIEPKQVNRIDVGRTALLNNSKTHVAITEIYEAYVSAEEHFNTGWWTKNNNKISYYNSKAELLFEKKGLDYKPKKVSDNGERIVCAKYADELLEGIKTDVSMNLRTKLVVLNAKGDVAYTIEEEPSSATEIEMSPNGNWIVYQFYNSSKSDDFRRYIDVANKKYYISKFGVISGNYIVRNDGHLEIEKFIKLSNENKRKYEVVEYNPKNNETKVIRKIIKN